MAKRTIRRFKKKDAFGKESPIEAYVTDTANLPVLESAFTWQEDQLFDEDAALAEYGEYRRVFKTARLDGFVLLTRED